MTILGGEYGKKSKFISIPLCAKVEHCGRKAYYTAFSKYSLSSKDSYEENFISH